MLQVFADVPAPRRCAGCAEFGADVCDACLNALAAGATIERRDIDGLERVTALGPYEGLLRSAILAFKYAGRRVVGTRLAEALARRMTRIGDVLVPVPLHAARQRSRGYNQADVVARALAAAVAISPPTAVLRDALRRVRPTERQSALDLSARDANVAGAFAPGDDAHRLAGRSVLLVDDVVTTGATLRACAQVLRSLGAASVAAACLAARL